MPPAGPGIQSSKPDKVDASLVNIKGHDYYKDEFVPPAEEVTEIDPRDKVSGAFVFVTSMMMTCFYCFYYVLPDTACPVSSQPRQAGLVLAHELQV